MYDIILFDLDGTITNSMPGITKCAQYALKCYGIDEPDINKLTNFIGPPLYTAFREYYQMTDEDAKGAVMRYREKYESGGLFDNSVYDGIPNMLSDLKKAGKTIVLATSKPEVFSKRILDYFDLTKYFDLVVGALMDESRNEKEQVIAEAVSHFDAGEKSKMVMVGDRKMDVYGARVNGIDVIGVKYGFAKENELSIAGADYIIDSVSELKTFLLSN